MKCRLGSIQGALIGGDFSVDTGGLAARGELSYIELQHDPDGRLGKREEVSGTRVSGRSKNPWHLQRGEQAVGFRRQCLSHGLVYQGRGWPRLACTAGRERLRVASYDGMLGVMGWRTSFRENMWPKARRERNDGNRKNRVRWVCKYWMLGRPCA